MVTSLRNRSRALLRYGIPALAVGVGGSVFFTPFADPRSAAVRVHYLGMGVLFLFLTFGEFCCLRIAWASRDAAKWRAVVRTAAWWRRLTEAVPGPAAILILLSGLRLLYEGRYSLQSPWLLLLVVGFGFLMGDGIFGYTREVRSLHGFALQASSEGPSEELRRFLRQPGFHGMRLLHYLSLPVLFVVGHQKVPRHIPLIQGPLAIFEEALLLVTGRMTGVTMVVLLVAFEVAVVAFLRGRSQGEP